MAQVSSISPLPDPNSHLQSVKSGSANSPSKNTPATVPAGVQSDEAQPSALQAQLTRLSGVLNGLQQTAASTRAQYVQAYNQVKSGTYTVNPLDVSRSIVNELLSAQ
jgi:hypothetical protein